MNISGPSIVHACRRLVECAPHEMLVLQDSLAHKPQVCGPPLSLVFLPVMLTTWMQTLSVRLGGSANGHNGVKSIISAMGNDPEFWRGRVGIREKDDKSDAADFVMKVLSKEELAFWGHAEGRGLEMVVREMGKIVLKNGEREGDGS